MRFGENISGADIEEEAGEEAEVEDEEVVGDSEEDGRGGADDGGEGVGEQEEFGFLVGVVISQHQRNGVHAIGEVVGDDGDGNNDADGGVNLKGEADTDTVHETVADQGQGGENANMRMGVSSVFVFVAVVEQDGFLDDMEEEETDDQSDHGCGGVKVMKFNLVDDFRKDIKSYDA